MSHLSVAETVSTRKPASEPRSDNGPAENSAATETQLEAIRNLCRRQSVDSDALANEKYKAESLAALTHVQAVELIRELNGRHASR
jgi:hypothetical protein